ncbi:MAG: Ku protein [Phycisphaerae bacterium]|nr:Ku protein [Phycisphaerae bacterium]
MKTKEHKPAAARAIWSGSISFGLVNIPVRMHTAVREDRISFHLLHDQDKVRLQRKMVCPEDGKEVHSEHMVKGYEISKGQYVIVQQSELEACSPEKTRSIEIVDFVELKQIDPIYFDRAYYLSPAEHAARPYRLLHEAMTRSGRVGIAKMVMHDKEYLACLRTRGNALCISTMHFGKEIVDIDTLGELPDTKIAEKELKAADQLIDSLLTDFDPGKYHDEYKDCVLAMIEKKANGEQIIRQATAHAKPSKAPDLMAALQASIAKAKAGAGSAPNSGNGGSTHGHHSRRKKSA